MDYISKILSKIKLNGLKMIVASKYIYVKRLHQIFQLIARLFPYRAKSVP